MRDEQVRHRCRPPHRRCPAPRRRRAGCSSPHRADPRRPGRPHPTASPPCGGPESLDGGEHIGNGRHGASLPSAIRGDFYSRGRLASCWRMPGIPMTIGTRMPSTSATTTPRSVPARSLSPGMPSRPNPNPCQESQPDRCCGEAPADHRDDDERDQVPPTDVGIDPATMQQRERLEAPVADHELRREDPGPRRDGHGDRRRGVPEQLRDRTAERRVAGQR